MDLNRVDILIRYIMAAAGQEDPGNRQLGLIHILKYIYLADLAFSTKHQGETFTGLPWMFYKFGPWAVEAHQRIAPVVKSMGAEERVYPSKYENDAVRWTLHDEDLLDELEHYLPREICWAVKKGVREFGSDTYGLLHFVYRTAPMLKAAPGELLDFRFAVPEPAGETPAEESAPPEPVKLSERGRKQRREALEDLRRRIRERLDNPLVAKRMVVPTPPRYDDVFYEGLKWMDELDGNPIEPSTGEIVFFDDIWKSPNRSEPGVP
jgi:hypothetical protein